MLYLRYGNAPANPYPPARRALLKFTLWTLGLLALVAAIYFVRSRLSSHGDRKAHAKKSAAHKLSRAEADRRDIQNLVTKLNANNPDAEPEAPASATRPDPRSAQRAPRARISSEASHGHDPDLPPSRGTTGR